MKLVIFRNKKSGIIGHLFRLKTFSSWLFGCYALRRFISLDEHGGSKASQGNKVCMYAKCDQNIPLGSRVMSIYTN